MMLISTVTLNLTLQQVNHVTTKTGDLCFNLLCSRWESQPGFWRMATWSFHVYGHAGMFCVCRHTGMFWQNGLQNSVPPFREGILLITQWQAGNACHHCRGTKDVRTLSTSLSFLRAKQDQMFQQRNETKVTLYLICGTTLTWDARSSFQSMKNDVY